MAFFKGKNKSDDSDLEIALRGIPVTGSFNIVYTTMTDNKEKHVPSQAYMLLVDAIDNNVSGSFLVNNTLAESLIGFVIRKDFLNKDYYSLSINGAINKCGMPVDGVLYLPLVLTNFIETLGINKDAKFTPLEGSPFTLLGIDGPNGLLPLILVTDSEGGNKALGLYLDAKGKLSSYSMLGIEKERKHLRNFVQSLTQNGSKTRKTLAENAPTCVRKDDSKAAERKEDGEINWEEPKSIVAYLNQYVVGQVEAKMVVAVAFSNYMTKVRTQNDELQKANMLLIGPSGTGKTYMVSLLAKKASLPMVQTKLTGKSSEGYKGENLSTVFEQIRGMTKGDAPYGIIFFDEIDKIARDDWGSSNGFGSRLQDELIAWVEEANVLGGALNTKNILFVTAGAFQGVSSEASLDDIIRKRIGSGKTNIGFNAEEQEQKPEKYMIGKVRPEDLIAYGLKPELVGRLPSIGVLHQLSIDDKVRILNEAKKSPLHSYTELLRLKGYGLEIDAGVPDVIAQHCPAETGARALSAICNDMFTEVLFDPAQYADASKVIKITPELAGKLINLYA